MELLPLRLVDGRHPRQGPHGVVKPYVPNVPMTDSAPAARPH
jgi:hypothetical protein